MKVALFGLLVALGSLGCDYVFPADPCADDNDERNDTRADATSLGTLTDDEEGLRIERSLPAAGDDDWFEVTIRDQGSDGNPEIDVELETDPWSANVGFEVYMRCVSGELVELDCSSGYQDDRLGEDACDVRDDLVNIQYDCEGGPNDSTDDATLTVHIFNDASSDLRGDENGAAECVGYALGIKVD
jgi:hypothetical protein